MLVGLIERRVASVTQRRGRGLPGSKCDLESTGRSTPGSSCDLRIPVWVPGSKRDS